ncbi:MAG: hypothetical protein JNL90_03370 [Planctomycetes bacterium]|nr:hypothetical protein [Planctomycetota bacterium]
MTSRPAAADRPRVLVVQDVPLSARQQKQFLETEAQKRALDVDVRIVDLRTPAERLVREQLQGEAPIDWLVVDLLVSEIDDHVPVEASTGMTLLRHLTSAGLFHGYKARGTPLGRGVRCIAVYSAMLQGQGTPRQRTEEALDALGVRRSSRYVPGDMARVAADVCDELAAGARAKRPPG